jgi:hypothetical protein
MIVIESCPGFLKNLAAANWLRLIDHPTPLAIVLANQTLEHVGEWGTASDQDGPSCHLAGLY